MIITQNVPYFQCFISFLTILIQHTGFHKYQGFIEMFEYFLESFPFFPETAYFSETDHLPETEHFSKIDTSTFRKLIHRTFWKLITIQKLITFRMLNTFQKLLLFWTLKTLRKLTSFLNQFTFWKLITFRKLVPKANIFPETD